MLETAVRAWVMFVNGSQRPLFYVAHEAVKSVWGHDCKGASLIRETMSHSDNLVMAAEFEGKGLSGFFFRVLELGEDYQRNVHNIVMK